MDILPQILINGLIAGASYGLIALGLSLIYGVMKFMNFAHGETAMVGAYFYYFFFITLAWPVIPSGIFALICTGIVGYLFNKIIFKPLSKESPWTLLVASVGVAFLAQAIVFMIAGAQSRSYIREGYETTVYPLFGESAVITNVQLWIIISTLIVLGGLTLFLKHTKLGKSIRAVSDNPQAAAIVGINPKKTVTLIFIISTVIAGLAGILLAHEQNLSPTMGLLFSVFAFSAVIVGGLGSIKGAVLGAFLLGFIQNLAVGIDWWGFSISTSYKNSIAFLVLILMLLIRPRGLFGVSLDEYRARK